jgi:hypothetical protein
MNKKWSVFVNKQTEEALVGSQWVAVILATSPAITGTKHLPRTLPLARSETMISVD